MCAGLAIVEHSESLGANVYLFKMMTTFACWVDQLFMKWQIRVSGKENGCKRYRPPFLARVSLFCGKQMEHASPTSLRWSVFCAQGI